MPSPVQQSSILQFYESSFDRLDRLVICLACLLSDFGLDEGNVEDMIPTVQSMPSCRIRSVSRL